MVAFFSAAQLKRLCNIDRGVWGGVAMAAPFYAEFFSWRWAVLLVIPLLIHVLVSRERPVIPHAAITPMIALLLLHVVALICSDTVYASQVIKDVLISSFLIAMYCLTGRNMMVSFFFVLIPIAVITALLGVVKAAMLNRGYFIGFIADSCPVYPAGSALCVNYNNLGMIWLVAILGSLQRRVWWMAVILIVAGALSSSRRFIVFVTFVPFVWILLQGKSALAKSAFLAIFSLAIIYLVSDSSSFEKYRFAEQPFTVLEFSGTQSQSAVTTTINRSAPLVMLETMTDGTLGTASRLAYWQLGLSMLKWLPQGWSYHQAFSCAFSPCTAFHYPHMPVISEWIIGGVVFGLIAIAFYAWPFWVIVRTGRILPIALFSLAMPYALLSGDTVFSLPICISCMLVALSAVNESYHKSRDSSLEGNDVLAKHDSK